MEWLWAFAEGALEGALIVLIIVGGYNLGCTLWERWRK